VSEICAKASSERWDNAWPRRALPRSVNPADSCLGNPTNRRIDRFLRRFLSDQRRAVGGSEARVLEVGCAGSPWLPYLGREFGYRLEGLDYSDLGCSHARTTLARAGVEGVIHNADTFEPPSALLRGFEVLFSFGLLEHFSPTLGPLLSL
jgi:hypothetical protein